MIDSMHPTKHAVMVVRFQGETIHDGQRALIEHVLMRHEAQNTLFVIGYTGGVPTKKDPLKKEMVEAMIRETYPFDFKIRFLADHPISKRYWSRNLDNLIAKEFGGEAAILYGSRKSFIDSYTGRYKTARVPMKGRMCGTDLRQKISFPNTNVGRAALIAATHARPDFCYAACDLAIIDNRRKRILLIKKNHHEGFYSFAGGHFEKNDKTGARCASREGGEEILGIRIGKPELATVMGIEDPRYRGTNDGVMSALYVAHYLGGTPSPGDDADEIGWLSLNSFVNRMVPWHRPMGRYLKKKYRL